MERKQSFFFSPTRHLHTRFRGKLESLRHDFKGKSEGSGEIWRLESAWDDPHDECCALMCASSLLSDTSISSFKGFYKRKTIFGMSLRKVAIKGGQNMQNGFWWF